MGYSPEKWTIIEEQLQWKGPEWLWDPLGKSQLGNEYKQLAAMEMGFSVSDAAILRKMRDCNLLFTTGIKAAILGCASGIPYVIQPHGGDLAIAAGRLRVGEADSWIETVFGTKWERAARKAFVNALAIGVHNVYLDPLLPLKKRVFPILLPHLKFAFSELATYTPIQSPLSRAQRQQLLAQLSGRFRFPADRQIIFVPSRIDFFWKGQQKLLKALVNGEIKTRFHFIFSGWGADLRK